MQSNASNNPSKTDTGESSNSLKIEIAETWDKILRESETAAKKKLSSTDKVCAREARKKLLRLTSDSIRSHRKETFREISLIPTEIRKAIRSCVTAESPWPLFLYGPPGTGKTCAALCLLDRLNGKGMYFTAGEFNEATMLANKDKFPWKADGRSGYMGATEFWRWTSETPLFVLDEIGVRNSVSDYHYEVIKRLCDCREFKPFLIISNVTPEKLIKIFDDRVYSRLSCGTIVDIQGNDMRST